MRVKAVVALILAGALLIAAPVSAGIFDKTGQSGVTFLNISPSAASAGMGDASTSLTTGADAAFYNPGGLGFLRGTADARIGYVKWFADINVSSGAVAVPIPIGGNPAFVAALSYVTMDYGDIYGTVINTDSTNSLHEVGLISPTETAIGLTVAKQFTDKFSVGVTAKLVSQTLPWYNTNGLTGGLTVIPEDANLSIVTFDAGTMYRTGFGSSVISMSIRNFGRTQTYELDGFRPPVTFRIGASMDVLDLAPPIQEKGHGLILACEGIHPPDHPEKVVIGLQYSFLDMLYLRGGAEFSTNTRWSSNSDRIYLDDKGDDIDDTVDYLFLVNVPRIEQNLTPITRMDDPILDLNYRDDKRDPDTRSMSLGIGLKYEIGGVRSGFDFAYTDFGNALGSVNYFTLSFGM
jgi:hypothetical protein